MTFTSPGFYLFLPAAFLVFHFTQERWRWLVLLAASYAFYATLKAPYLLAVLVAVTAISYGCGVGMAGARKEGARRAWLWGGIASCLGALTLKYLPLLAGAESSPTASLVTVGVSYFSLQAVSYLVDVYLELEEAERHPGRYALYLAFFPKLLQGPIERGGDLLPQLKEGKSFDYDRVRDALLLFAQGLFKKVVVADRLGLYVDRVYNDLHNYPAVTLLLASYAYALQIYFDFSAYTDMARGTGRIFGIELTENFNSPYLATSVADFWRRWHISFSRWILDYVFKPLQMAWRNAGQAGTAAALLVTFLLSGFWHGASWTFVAWGGIHGLYLACSTLYRPYQKKLHQLLGVQRSRWLKYWQIFVTFHLVTAAWVFFRADSVADACYVFSALAKLRVPAGVTRSLADTVLAGLSLAQLLILLFSLGILFALKRGVSLRMTERPAWTRMLVYHLMVAVIVLLKVQQSTFIYFKF